MEEDALRAEIERRVRLRLQPAFDAQKDRVPLTDEQKREQLELMPTKFREMVERDGWPEPIVISEESREAMVRKETDEVTQIIIERRVASGRSGPLDEDELHEAYMSRTDIGLEFMLTRLRDGTQHPIREAMIQMIEQGKEYLGRLRDKPTEEDVAEISERLAAQFQDFDIEGTMKKYKDWADKHKEE